MRRKDVEEFPFNDLAKSTPSQRTDAGSDFYANTQPKMKTAQLPTDVLLSSLSSENQEKPAANTNMQNGYFVYPQQVDKVEDENPLIMAANRNGEATTYKQSVSAPKREIEAYEFLSDKREQNFQSGEQTTHKRHTLDRQIQILFCISAVLFMLVLLLVYLVFY